MIHLTTVLHNLEIKSLLRVPLNIFDLFYRFICLCADLYDLSAQVECLSSVSERKII